eukprot:354659_1
MGQCQTLVNRSSVKSPSTQISTTDKQLSKSISTNKKKRILHEIIDDGEIQATKLEILVNGYLNNNISGIWNNNNYEKMLYVIILNYLIPKQLFESHNIGKYHKFGLNNVVTHNGGENECVTSFCSNVVSGGQHRWIFKIREGKRYNCILLGIWKVTNGNEIKWPQKSVGLTWRANGYGYNVGYGNHHATTNQITSKNYGKRCETGAMIEMCLNFTDMSLSYCVDGCDQGIAFIVENSSYKAAITTFFRDESVQFMQYINSN